MNPLKKKSNHQKDLVDVLSDLIVESIQDIKGENIIKLDLRQIQDNPTSFFIICEGSSTTQVHAISNNIYKRMKYEYNDTPFSFEGKTNGNWILMDYFTIVVHIFHKETREYYQLEDLWSDAKATKYPNM